MHVRDLQTEFFRDDGARVRARARAEVLRADRDRDRPIASNRHINLALRTPATAPHADAATKPALQRPVAAARRRVAPRPIDLTRAAFELAMISRGFQVLFAKLKR